MAFNLKESRLLHKYINQRCSIYGMILRFRELSKVSFLNLIFDNQDVQIVIKKDVLVDEIKTLKVGSFIRVYGELKERENRGVISYELLLESFTEENLALEVSPIIYSRGDLKESLDLVLKHRGLSLRSEDIRAIFRVKSEVILLIEEYFGRVLGANRYISPIIVRASEGGSEVFSFDCIGRRVSLTQSGQLIKEMIVSAFSKVFSISPFFRAERSFTTRHLCEANQLEFEQIIYGEWTDVMDNLESFIKYLVGALREKFGETLSRFNYKFPEVSSSKFMRISVKEANILHKSITGVSFLEADDITPQEQVTLSKFALENYGSEFFFLTHWKVYNRAFYSYSEDDDITNTFDLILGKYELSSGGERINSLQKILTAIKLHNISGEGLEEYLGMFNYGVPKHGGFGLGIERLIASLLGLDNIRSATLFPTDCKRVAGF